MQAHEITVGEARYLIQRQFDPRKDVSQLIVEQLVRKNLPTHNPAHKIDTPSAQQL